MARTLSPNHILTKLFGIAELARRVPEMVLTTLAHHIDVHFLYEAYRQVRKDGAVGVDKVKAADYAENLTENLKDLLERFKSGSYWAPAVRRVHIPKGSSVHAGRRPIGIPTFEDKVLQKAVAMVLEAIYEQVFYWCSYGFRPGKNQHQALDALREGIQEINAGWVLEVDIKGYFNNINHQKLRQILDRRVRDGVIRRLIDKWLAAGVSEEGVYYHPETGTPQGGVISPILSNIYLHDAVDEWCMKEMGPRLKGQARHYRFADDFVQVFERKDDAEMVLAALKERLAEYGLEVHPEKTKIVQFNQPRRRKVKGPDHQKPGSFDFLGFTIYWGKSRGGKWVVKKKTCSSRLKSKLVDIEGWMKKHRHMSMAYQHEKISAKLKGHYSYYGVTGNFGSVNKFFRGVKRKWWKWLCRRSQRRRLNADRFFKKYLVRFPLPRPFLPKSVYRS